jgi:hypothetical protein
METKLSVKVTFLHGSGRIVFLGPCEHKKDTKWSITNDICLLFSLYFIFFNLGGG